MIIMFAILDMGEQSSAILCIGNWRIVTGGGCYEVGQISIENPF